MTRIILLETIYQKCKVETPKQKQRLPEKLSRILTHYKEIEWIKNYQLTTREVKIFF